MGFGRTNRVQLVDKKGRSFRRAEEYLEKHE
jgi:hypothetical protein